MLQSPLGVMMGYNNDSPFSSPPPAHMGIPPVTIDPKTGLLQTQTYIIINIKGKVPWLKDVTRFVVGSQALY